MKRKRLLWQIFVSYLFITILALAAALAFASYAVRHFYYQQITNDLESRARLLEDRIKEMVIDNDPGLDALCEKLGDSSGTRITVVSKGGEVLADSERSPDVMDDHSDRPEVREALSGELGMRTRFSKTMGKDMVYIALPLEHEGRTIAVLRNSVPLGSVVAELEAVYGRILLGGLVIAVLAAATGLIISRKITKPLEEMRRGAEDFARGDLSSRLHVPRSKELGGLAEAMNEMAVQLDERIKTITRRRNEQNAILSSMVEGVVGIDIYERIISINKAAVEMLGANRQDLAGRSVQEIVRNKALQKMVSDVLEKGVSVEEEIVIDSGGPRHLQATSAMMRDDNGKVTGAVLVLNDITRIRRLETVRSEFVANVSHELRTPITSIKGFVETILEGAIKSPEDTERFLNIISRQVNQLNAIIEDLLLLSRLEGDPERASMPLKPGKICEVLESAVEVCGLRAVDKDISIGLDCAVDLSAEINVPLLTQAVVNLIDNAVIYSGPGSEVLVEARLETGEVRISVTDQGPGIDDEHLSRLFERFYRVDRARSRKLGGTGLGLAIVKHIVQSHGGSVSVSSKPGKGSVFIIILPSSV